MKKRAQFLIVFLCLSFSIHAVDILHIPDGPVHKFEVVDPEFPPYYLDTVTDTYPDSGYSYMWHTDEGHVSNEEKPEFFFATSGSHDVHLTLTPRKKGDEDLKVSAVFNFNVNLWETSPLSNGGIADEDMYLDGEARKDDIINIVVPLNSCQQQQLTQYFKVGFDESKLEFLGLLPQSNLSFTAPSSHPDAALGQLLNMAVHFSYNWDTSRDDVVAVIQFKVLADMTEPVVLKYHKPNNAQCDSDVEIAFRTIRGPYDPNYKESDVMEINVVEQPGKKVSSTEVLYTIHFQNIGDAPVDSVTIFDVLPAYLSFVSFEGSSEPGYLVNTSVIGSTLQWIIAPSADIKGTNESPTQPEPSTKGWVRFKADIAKEEDILYDTCYCLANIATIYFDTLSPITTEADVIVIGDSLCFSSLPIGLPYSDTFCNNWGVSTSSSSTKNAHEAEPREEASFSVYPNPFSSSVRWTGDIGEAYEVEVFDAKGQPVFPLSIRANEIELGNQPNGLYFIRVLTDQGQHIAPVMKY